MNRFPNTWPISIETVSSILERDLAHSDPQTRALAIQGLRTLGREATAPSGLAEVCRLQPADRPDAPPLRRAA